MNSKKTAAVLLVILSCNLLTLAKDKEAADAHIVDAGTFGVFMNGRRVGTETFSIKQGPKGSSVTSEFKADGAAESSTQDSELQLNAAGELQKYEWKEISPGKSGAVVLPNDNFLVERVSVNPTDKPQEHPFMLPSSTSVLDDYFFVQREVLVWKYLAMACKQDKGLQCPQNQKTQFGTLNPHAQNSMPVSMEFSGREKIPFKGTDREVNRFTLKTDNGDWSLWIDDQLKLLRILIASDNTEVLRD